jgi:energy-coupling factor transporter transmembrane protein EcfT
LTAFVASVVWFYAARDSFVHNAHYWSAAPMFVCIVVVVWINAIAYRQKEGTPRLRNRYYAIAIAMVMALIALVIAKFAGWDYWLLALEAALITLFAVFWTTQTVELWREGLRSTGEHSA